MGRVIDKVPGATAVNKRHFLTDADTQWRALPG